MEIHLISYGDQRYELRSGYFMALAFASSSFDKVTVFRHEDFDIDFEKEFHEELQFTLSGGRIWRPYFIKRALQVMKDGDILVYYDQDFEINKLGKKRFDYYLDLLNQTETGVVGFQHLDPEYTKWEVCDYFNITSGFRDTGQLKSAVVFLRKCHHSVQLIDLCNDAFSQMPVLVGKDRGAAVQSKDLMDKRNAQGVWKALLKIYSSMTS